MKTRKSERLCAPNGYLNSSDIEMLISTNGFYTDGIGNTKSPPPTHIEVRLIAEAIYKRIRKSKRNIAVNANAWIGDEHGVPLPRISL